MRLARRASSLMIVLLALCAAVSAQKSRPSDDPRNQAPTVGTGGPPGGPTGLFTIYDGQTLRKGEFTFSIAYSNFDRDPGDVDITEVPLSFQLGLGDHLALWFNTDGYRGINVHNPNFGLTGNRIAPPFTSRLGTPTRLNNNFGAAANFPGIGSVFGSILPGGVLTQRRIPANLIFAAQIVPDLFTLAPSYLPDAPFINRLYGESSFNTFNMGTKWRWTSTHNPLGIGIGIMPFYILNSNPRDTFGDTEATMLNRGDELLAGVGVDVPINKHFQWIAELKSVQYVGGHTPNAFPNNPVGTSAHLNQQSATPLNASEGATRASVESEESHESGFQFFLGRHNLRTAVVLPNQPPVVTLSSSSAKIVLGDKCGTNDAPNTNCTPASTSVQLRAQASDPDGDTLLYTWTTTGGIITGDGPNVTWDLSGVQPGTYNANIEVDDGVGCINFASTTVTVEGVEHPAGESLGDLTARDKIHSAADKLFREGRLLQSKGAAALLQEAIAKYKEALSNWKQINDSASMTITYQKLADAYYSLGEYQQAIVNYNEALSITRTTGDPRGEASILNNIGELYNDLAEYPKALDYLDQALMISEKIDDRQALATILYSTGNIYFNQGKINESLDRYQRSLAHFRELGDRRGESLALHGLGRIYASLGEYQKAIDSYNQVIPLARSGDNKTTILASVHFDMGRTYRALGNNHKALDYYEESLRLNRISVDRNMEAHTLYELALVTRDTGDLDKSREYIEAALKIVDSLRINIPSSELRSTYFASVQACYGFYIDLLVQLHKQRPLEGFDAMALEASERARARRLLELLTEAGTDIRQGIDPRLIDSERSTRQELNNIAARQIRLLSRQHTEEEAEALATQIDELTSEYKDIQVKIGIESPHYAALVQPQPLSLADIREQVLDEDTLLLEYVLGDERSFLFAVDSKSISVHELPKREDIEAAGVEAYRLLSARNSYRAGEAREQRQAHTLLDLTSYKDVSRRLSRMLLDPVAQQLGTKRLLIVASGALQYVPFGALPVPNRATGTKAADYLPLIVDHEVVNLPSASTLAILRRETTGRKLPPKAVAVLADPVVSKQDERITASADRHSAPNSGVNADDRNDQSFSRLLGTRWEANQIASLVAPSESMLALDFNANRATAIGPGLAKYRTVHFATHGFINEEQPQLSGIMLSLYDRQGHPEDGFLRLNDIYNMKLPVDLVVLSGCTTGIGKDTKGEGYNGLTRGFMYAGARRVVLSLWSVDDQATADLMVRFYRKMLVGKLSPAAALRGAQIEMLRDRRWNSPYYWAAFMIQGEYR